MIVNPRYYQEETATIGNDYDVARVRQCDENGEPIAEWTKWMASFDFGYDDRGDVGEFETREEAIAACIVHAERHRR